MTHKAILKKTIFISFSICCTLNLFAQDTTTNWVKQKSIYTGVYNQVGPMFPYPLVGFVNSAEGNQQNVHIGFVNMVHDSLDGVQVGLANVVGGSTNGVQCAMVNISNKTVNGVQVGFLNFTHDSIHGVQVGYLNLAKNITDGVQCAFVNVAKKNTDGMQFGYVNITCKNLNGAQIGFVNSTCKDANGAQIGFVNITGKTHQGTQIGFINIADSFASGIPIGYISIVKKGGYYAMELSANELYTYNVAFRIGVKSLYSSFSMAYQPLFNKKFASGMGIGSVMPLGRFVSINPELQYLRSIERNDKNFLQLSAIIGLGGKRIVFNLGPTVVWSNFGGFDETADNGITSTHKPKNAFAYEKLDNRNTLHIGAKASLIFKL